MNGRDNRSTQTVRWLVSVAGIVQGVGFRPFVYQQASRLGLAGTVFNTGGGVEIDAEGPEEALEELVQSLTAKAPPLARISRVDVAVARQPSGRQSFEIGSSVDERHGAWQPVSPDSCTCDECLRELFDPDDRRYRYPFINCTNCGPRFTIIEGLPYDRPLTTMKAFDMCPACKAEYEDPGNRRFHAEPNACAACGPSLWLEEKKGVILPSADPVEAAARALREGLIVAIKGLGGFQLACLATDERAVALLRQRKRRPHKPFALMMESSEEAALRCLVSRPELDLLRSPERPIVLLEQHEDTDIAGGVAPGLDRLGVMLPSTPVHFLLMREVQTPLVMTSGNISEEPICRTNEEAASRLEGIADAFLMHDREIVSAFDDSVAMIVDGEAVLIRRARGYAPLPLKLPAACSDSLLAVGGELKNTFCLTKGSDAFVSQHIGDLRDADTLLTFELIEAQYERLFKARPSRLVADRHPDYLSTAYSRERDPSAIRVQHHRAHIASCLVENEFTGLAVGVALDGTGFGDDGSIWGGEFFVGSMTTGFERAAHFEYMPLLGGDAAIREPWRMALAATWEYAPADIDFIAGVLEVSEAKLRLLQRQLETGLNCPRTSSCGRLFDAVAAMSLGLKEISYEAQAAIEFEAAANRCLRSMDYGLPGREERRSGDPGEAAAQHDPHGRLGQVSYRFSLDRSLRPWIISPARVIKKVIGNIASGESPGNIARRFHLGLAEVIVRTSVGLAELHGLRAVALSGGVFQNRLLLEKVRGRLADDGLMVLINRKVPSNDGGISLGQAAIACAAHRVATAAPDAG